MAALAASGLGDATVCGPGSEAGQCQDPRGVAVDVAAKRAYVADFGNDRVDVFEVDEVKGEVKFLFSFGEAGSGPGQFDGPWRIAIDEEGAADHVYVYDSGNYRVEEFELDGSFVRAWGSKGTGPGQFNDAIDQIAVGSGGVLYVADMPKFNEEPRIERFDGEGNLLGECAIPREDRMNGGLAVGPGGEIYAAFNRGGGIFRFEYAEPECAQAGAPYPLDPAVEVTGLTMGEGGALFAAQNLSRVSGAGVRAITKYDAAGNTLRRFGLGFTTSVVPGLAVLPTGLGDVFAAGEAFGGPGGVSYLSEPPPGPLGAALETPKATLGNTKATLEAEIDPEGKPTTYQFEYTTRAAYEAEGFTGARKAPAAPGSLDGGAEDFELHLAGEQVGCPDPLSEAGHPGETAIEAGECLNPETKYVYRASFENEDGTGDSPMQGEFETPPPLEITATYASAVGTDTARLGATVDPLGIPTSGYFEYVTQAQFEATEFEEATEVPAVGKGAGPLDFGASVGPVSRGVALELAPATTYHLRLVAQDPLIEPRRGKEEVFSTFAPETGEEGCPANEAFRTGAGALLPDCRAYEMVSPLVKEGGDIIAAEEAPYNLPSVLEQASASGQRLAYGTYRAFGDAESAPFTAQYVAARTPEGWRSHYVLGHREALTTPARAALQSESRIFSPDLCEEWLVTAAEPSLAPAAPEGQPNLYRRFDGECGEGGQARYEAVTTAVRPSAPVALNDYTSLEPQGTSADGSKTIYAERGKLTADAPDLHSEALALYWQEAGEGQPHFVCVMPSGNPISKSCAAGSTENEDGKGRTPSLANAISADGERVWWSTPAGSGGVAHKLYLRINPGAGQSAVAGGECTEPQKACTLAVSKEGEEASGSEGAQFWWAAADGRAAVYRTGTDLYEYDAEAKASTLIAHKSFGVLGAAEDLSRLYFASEEALASEANPLGAEPQAGKPNLYLREAGGPLRFVATLVKSSDVTSLHSAVALKAVYRTSRVSADGEQAAFMSTGSPMGYDNADAVSEAPDAEVYLYDAAADGGAGRLVCASCNPSGGRPVGEKLKGAEGTTAAAWMAVWSKSLYPGRYLAEGGRRLFFEARDALVPRDTNGAADVYQWEAAGEGGCKQGRPDYHALNEGCVDLISSGQAAGGASFADASPSGNDVFFATAASLLPQDYGLVDIYDARAGGGLPAPAAREAECEGEACQSPAPAPEALAPGSLGYQGPGNVHHRKNHKARKCPKGKHQVKRDGRTRCVPKHRKHHKSRRQRRRERGRGWAN